MSVTKKTTTDGVDVLAVTVCRADELAPGTALHAATIDMTEPIPGDLYGDRDYLARARVFYRAQAQDVLAALHHALPGGTLDALFALMAEQRASVYRIRVPLGGDD
jgi:hypothetical protein